MVCHQQSGDFSGFVKDRPVENPGGNPELFNTGERRGYGVIAQQHVNANGGMAGKIFGDPLGV